MSLLTAHKVLVVTAILFCAGFAVREAIAVAAGTDRGLVPLFLGAIAAAGAVGLVLYLRWLLRTKGRALDPAAERRRRARDN